MYYSYAELHCKTNFSFLEGASHPDELVATAKERGYAALAVTDRNSLAGVVRTHVEAKEHGLKLIIGAEIHPSDAPPVVLWATDRKSYGRLCRLITVGRLRAEKGSCNLQFEDIAQHAEGLIAGVVPSLAPDAESAKPPSPLTPLPQSRERGTELFVDHFQFGDGNKSSFDPPLTPPFQGGELETLPFLSALKTTQINSSPLSRLCGRGAGGEGVFNSVANHSSQEEESIIQFPSLLGRGQGRVIQDHFNHLINYKDIFRDRLYILAELFRGPDDRRRLLELQALSKSTGIPLVAANDVHYHSPKRLPLHDVVTAIRLGTTVDAVGKDRFPNAQRHLRHIDEIMAAFAEERDAIRRTVEIANRCTFNLDELRYEYPEELVPAGRTPSEYLAELTWEGAKTYYPNGVPDKVRRIVEHELGLIKELQYEAYFLTVYDLVRFAREQKILCQGRGSAANSAVCYCLGVTPVDPDRIEVLFERFVSKERNEAPDIDIDFEHERREEVLQYLYKKYGRERAGLAATVITYCARSAIRDVGKALGLSLDCVDALAKNIDGHHHVAFDPAKTPLPGIEPNSRLGSQLLYLVNEILGFPRHLSQHVGGMVMTQGPLCELVPIENAAMENRSVVQWDKDDLDALGILKVDVLALGMLSAIRKCFALVKQHYGRELTLANVPSEDQTVYDRICAADTIGVFQIESRGQMSMLPRLKPNCYYDLVIEVAIVRPGPIQGEMVHPYLRRRHGEEVPAYPNDEIKAVLDRTLGVPLFQEQAMRLAVVAAGFTPGEADQLRRAMGAWRKTGVMEKFRTKLIEGMRAKGLNDEFANQVFTMIRGFGEYGFPESHAAAFAILAYVSAWLKCYYPAAFTSALLNSQPMGFYAPAQLVSDARRHGVPVLPVDVNYSEGDCTLEFPHRRFAKPPSPLTPLPQSRERGTEIPPLTPPFQGGELETLQEHATNSNSSSFSPLCGRGAGGEGKTEQEVESDLAPKGRRMLAQGVSPGSESHNNLQPRRGETNGVALSGLELNCSMTQGSRPGLTDAPPGLKHESPIALRLGLRLVSGLGKEAREVISTTRRDGPFTSLPDFIRRTKLGRGELEILADADAFGSLALERRQALWHTMAQSKLPKATSLFTGVEIDEPVESLPRMTDYEQIITDYRTIGLSLKGHPMQFFREQLDPLKVVTAEQLPQIPNGGWTTVAGIVILRQRPSTAKGITFCTLEDETGPFNLVVKQHTWERYAAITRRSQAWIAHGVLQCKDSVIHVVVNRLEDMSKRLGELRIKSRDFA